MKTGLISHWVSALYQLVAEKGSASGYAELDASGDVPDAQVPNLNASKITAGTLGADRIPTLDAAKIGTGTLGADRIPTLDAAKIGTGTLGADRIPTLDAAKIGTGTIDSARLPFAVGFPGTQAFSGTPPTSWTDLDLSSIVGARAALVVLKIVSTNSSPTRVGFRTNGETAELHLGANSFYANGISGLEEIEDSEFSLVAAITDSSGILEWLAGAAYATMTVDVIAYIAA